MKSLLSAVVAGGVALSASIASADIIWSDGFNRYSSYTVGNGWYELEKTYKDVGIGGNDYLYLYDDANSWPAPDAGVKSKKIDASHYENIWVEFAWYADYDNEKGKSTDRLHLSWDKAPSSSLYYAHTSAWNQAWSGSSDGGGWYKSVVQLGANADQSIFNLAFWTNIGVNKKWDKLSKEGFLVDYVVVHGDEIPKATPVPLPASGLMLLAGAGAFAALRRRKAK